MKAYRLEKRITKKGSLNLSALPFEEGDLVEVIVLAREKVTQSHQHFPLRGTVKKYVDPTEPVASDEWEATRR